MMNTVLSRIISSSIAIFSASRTVICYGALDTGSMRREQLTVACSVLAHRCCDCLSSDFLWIANREDKSAGVRRGFVIAGTIRLKVALEAIRARIKKGRHRIGAKANNPTVCPHKEI